MRFDFRELQFNAEQLLENVIEQNNILVFYMDGVERSIIMPKGMFTNTDRISLDRLVSEHFLYPTDRDLVRGLMDSVSRGDENGEAEVRFHLNSSDEYRWYKIRFNRVSKDGNDRIGLCTAIDVTEKHSYREKINRIYEDVINDESKLETSVLWNALYRSFYMIVVIDGKTGHAREIVEHPQNNDERTIYIDSFDVNSEKYFRKYATEGTLQDVIEKTRVDFVKKELEKEEVHRVVFDGKDVYGRMRNFQIDFFYMDKDFEVIGCTVSDVTEVVQFNRDQQDVLRMTMEREQRAQEAKNQFFANMSHEIRTPLNAIVGMAEIAKMDIHNPHKVEECMDIMLNSSKELVNVVSNILDSSSFKSGNVHLVTHRVKMQDFVKSIESDFNSNHRRKDQTFAINQNTSHGEFIMDEERLKRMLLNVLANAAKFSPHDGHIDLDIIERAGESENEGYYDFVIRDHGKGIAEEDICHVFEPFFRDKESAKNYLGGTGLGLSVVKNIADAMGAEVAIDSKISIGTSVKISVPVKFVAQSARPRPAAGGNKRVLEGCRVLVAEDQPVNMVVAKKMLERFGGIVDVAENGKIAVDKYLANPPGTYDFIFMDIQMPIMDGYEATKAIRASGHNDAKNVRIISMTADVLASDVEMAREVGMNGHIGKPIHTQDMENLIMEALKRRFR